MFFVKLFLVIGLGDHFTPYLYPNLKTCTWHPTAETWDLKDAALVDSLNSWPVGQIATVGAREPESRSRQLMAEMPTPEWPMPRWPSPGT